MSASCSQADGQVSHFAHAAVHDCGGVGVGQVVAVLRGEDGTVLRAQRGECLFKREAANDARIYGAVPVIERRCIDDKR